MISFISDAPLFVGQSYLAPKRHSTKMSAVHPIGRIGRPEEIADAVAWLFSDRSSYYTGQSLILDGGLTAQRPYVTQPPASDKRLQNVRDERPFQGIHLD